jgi:peroxiredoxin
VVIGPSPFNHQQQARLDSFPMPILSDRGLWVSSTYGLTMELPEELREQYAKAGYVPPSAPRNDNWLVPIPATYLIDRTGHIVMATIDTDFRNRLHPIQLLSALRNLQRRTTVF